MMQQQIDDKVTQVFSPDYCLLENESHMHAGPATESHFKLVLVSKAFDGVGKVKRHQAVYKVLADEMAQIHALALHLFTPDEWKASQLVPLSPLCQGAGH
jgi:BolA protein